MTRIILLLLVLLTAAPAQTSLWRVVHNADTLYVGGSIHLMKANDYPLPPAFEQAYRWCEELILELHMDSAKTPANIGYLIGKTRLPEGTTLQTLLNEEAFKGFNSYCAAQAIPWESMNGFRPWYVSTMLTQLAMMKQEYHPIYGLDMHFFERAKDDKKKLGGLESFRFQIDMLAGLDSLHASDLIMETLAELETVGSMIDDMKSAWRNGNMGQLDSLMNGQAMSQYPELMDNLLTKRNKHWVGEIEQMLGQKRRIFLIGGVGHMAGSEGLIPLLKAKGMTVTQLGGTDE